MRERVLIAFTLACCLAGRAMPTNGGEPAAETPAQRGYRCLTTKPYLPPDFDQEVFDSLWKRWPAELRRQAQEASPADRRRMTFERYGMVERPGSEGRGPALGYVDDGTGGWVMNCLTCHTGKVAGQTILGAPNSQIALATLTEDVVATKLLLGKKLAHLDLGSVSIPLGGSRGTTNSVIFGVALGRHRDKDLNFDATPRVADFQHHDMDPPAFWNVRRKTRIYVDGFAPKYHRTVMQFMMVPKNSGATLRSWEGEFRDVLAWIESLSPPKYPYPIDQRLAEQGRTIFERNCATCHGTYGTNGAYPNRIVPLEEVGTDPIRLRSLPPEYRRALAAGWIGDYGKLPYDDDPGGYVAPPLDGVWASAPYFHNGSVPTLWHVLHPGDRPQIWKRTSLDGYDRDRVGLAVIACDAVPKKISAADRREYFETDRPGKSAAGHRFPETLTESEKTAVLEYLKSL